MRSRTPRTRVVAGGRYDGLSSPAVDADTTHYTPAAESAASAEQSKEVTAVQSDKKKGWLARFIERLAEASDREFHGTPPKCCGNPEIKKFGDRSSKAEK